MFVTTTFQTSDACRDRRLNKRCGFRRPVLRLGKDLHPHHRRGHLVQGILYVALRVWSSSGHQILRALLMVWMRYFGPMRMLVSDQDGGLHSDESGARLEKLSLNPMSHERI